MTTVGSVQANAGTWARDGLHRARFWLSGRRIWWAAGTVVLMAGVALSWSWLVAIGLAPLLIAVLPCVAMCALGLCMNRMFGSSCAKEAGTDQGAPKIEERSPRPNGLADAARAAELTAVGSVPAETRAAARVENAGRGA